MGMGNRWLALLAAFVLVLPMPMVVQADPLTRAVKLELDLTQRIKVLAALRGGASFQLDMGDDGRLTDKSYGRGGSGRLNVGASFMVLPQCIAKYIQSSTVEDIQVMLVNEPSLSRSSQLRFTFRPGADVAYAKPPTVLMQFDMDPLRLVSAELQTAESGASGTPLKLAEVCHETEIFLMRPQRR